MFVCYWCCVLSGRGLCDELITRPEESYRLWWVFCDIETSIIKRPCLALGRSAIGGKKSSTLENLTSVSKFVWVIPVKKVNNCRQITRRISRALTEFIATSLLRMSGAKSDY